uniref:ribonucleoside-diphosphate reductase n=1 Tax=viral metagenome TaxID=1070528 RepID=A0A6M3MB60_9ZZZZ
MTATHHPLPIDRTGRTFRFEITTTEEHPRTVDGYFIINTYEDGTPGELFIHMDKTGSTVSGLLDCWAITVSIALQHGVPLDAICHKLSGIRFPPEGKSPSLTNNGERHEVSSIVDLICRRLLGWMGEEV